MNTLRTISQTIDPQTAIEGAGVRLLRSFGPKTSNLFDPFLLFDHFAFNDPLEGPLRGFPYHPHRGIETVTYMLEGSTAHRDSLGNEGLIGPGDVQWMSSGRGIMHEELAYCQANSVVVDVEIGRASGAWEAYAIEINLRKGGTTHPFLTLQFLTDGTYDPNSGIFTVPSGRHKYFIATDHLASPLYKAFTPDDLFDISMRHKLHFDQSRQTGVIFHMMTALAEAGQVGMTAVGESPQEAEALYKKANEALDQEAQAALEFSTKL